MTFVNVAIPVPVHKAFTYAVPGKFEGSIQPGMRVVVQFRKKTHVGYITEVDINPSARSGIKEIISLPDNEPAIEGKLFKLLNWISEYYCAPVGEVFAAATPNLLNSAREIGKIRKTKPIKHQLEAFHKKEVVTLTNSQKDSLLEIENLLKSEVFFTTLLHGVTGSGKTEVYLRLINNVLASGKQAILLVPEISLVPQLSGRIASYSDEPFAIYHSGLPEAQRLNQWQLMKDGKANIVIGTRSAIFAPFKNLGLIIVDEEHDNSYKQEESPRYNARDVAVMRGKTEKVPVILGSATPSIESYYNAKNKKYHYIDLPERHGESKLPDIEIIDMRKQVRSNLLNPYLSIELLGRLEKEIKNKHQAILFLNRRGYSNFFICQGCGFIPECPNCHITLTYHKRAAKLCCHYCDYKIKPIATCPKCKGLEITAIGSGTEMIEEAIRQKLPNARIERLDRDTTTTEKRRRETLGRMRKGELDILIGTQMVTKGHDFPNVTLVGIISADQSIHFPDFRSGEKTFQLLTQVSGRAGRALHPGRVIIQTYNPEHLSIKAASCHSLEDFISSELSVRKDLSYPPYSRLANIRITGNEESRVITGSNEILRLLKNKVGPTENLKILGPAPAPLVTIKGKTRWQLLIKSPSAKILSSALSEIRGFIDANHLPGIQVSIDVDPMSTM